MEIGERIVISHFLAPAPVFLKGESESSTTGENCKKGRGFSRKKCPLGRILEKSAVMIKNNAK